MPYNVEIRSESGEQLKGTVYFYNESGTLIGEAVVQPGGSQLDEEVVEQAHHFRVYSDGYSWYGGVTMYDTNTFTLVRQIPTVAYIVIAAIGGMILSKFIKL